MAQPELASRGERILKRIGWITVVVLVLGLGGGALLLGRFGADTPVAYQDELDHFKYGSLGSEHEFGVPYWIWRALPELFEDKLPQPGRGWESVGFVFEKGKHLPVGMSQRRYLGFDVVGLHCASAMPEPCAKAPRASRRCIPQCRPILLISAPS